MPSAAREQELSDRLWNASHCCTHRIGPVRKVVSHEPTIERLSKSSYTYSATASDGVNCRTVSPRPSPGDSRRRFARTLWKLELRKMIRTFERDGIRLQYPANWTLEAGDHDADGAWSVAIQSPETAFLQLSLRPDAETPAELADQILDALKAEYKELDAANAVDQFAGQIAIGHDMDFLTLDTSIACWTRCVETPAGPLLVLCQVSEYDRDRNEPVLLAIAASLKIEDE